MIAPAARAVDRADRRAVGGSGARDRSRDGGGRLRAGELRRLRRARRSRGPRDAELGGTPAVIIECGNMANADDAAVMSSETGRQRIAEALIQGVPPSVGIGGVRRRLPRREDRRDTRARFLAAPSSRRSTRSSKEPRLPRREDRRDAAARFLAALFTTIHNLSQRDTPRRCVDRREGCAWLAAREVSRRSTRPGRRDRDDPRTDDSRHTRSRNASRPTVRPGRCLRRTPSSTPGMNDATSYESCRSVKAPRATEQDLLMGHQTAQAHRVHRHVVDQSAARPRQCVTGGVRRGQDAGGTPGGGNEFGRAPGCAAGASAFPGWCSSMISTDSKKRAACSAKRIKTAPTKFGATSTPTEGASRNQSRSVAAGARRSRSFRRRPRSRAGRRMRGCPSLTRAR